MTDGAVVGWGVARDGGLIAAGLRFGATQKGAFKAMLRADPCAYCDRPVSGTLDHIVPQVTGGRSGENLVGACAACNVEKAHRTLLMFLRSRHHPDGPPQARRGFGGAIPRVVSC